MHSPVRVKERLVVGAVIIVIALLFYGVQQFFGNGLSEKDKAQIETRIKYHNAMVGASERPESRFADTFILMKPNLTYAEFMQYCETRNLDPLKTVEKLSER